MSESSPTMYRRSRHSQKPSQRTGFLEFPGLVDVDQVDHRGPLWRSVLGLGLRPEWACALLPSEELARIEAPLNGGQVAALNVIALSMALQGVTSGVAIDVRVVEHSFAAFPSVLEHLEPGVVVAQLYDQLAIGACLSHLRARNLPACWRQRSQGESVLP